MSLSYHEQFRENRRGNHQTGLFSNAKATAGNKLPPQRPTAVVKQTIRSDTFTLPAKNRKSNQKVPPINQTQNGSQRPAPKKSAIINSTPPAAQKPPAKMMNRPQIRSIPKTHNAIIQDDNLQRKPVRFADDNDNDHRSYSAAVPVPAHHQRAEQPNGNFPLRSGSYKSRYIHVDNDDYLVQLQKSPPNRAYTNNQGVSDIPTISYTTSLPRITQSADRKGPTVIIHPRDAHYSDKPTIVPIVSIPPPYHPPPPPPPPLPPPPSIPIMILPSPNAPSYAPGSTMVLPPSNSSTYVPFAPTILPLPTVPNLSSGATITLPASANPAYVSQPLFFPTTHISHTVPSSAPPQQQTIISQSSSASVSTPAQVKAENKAEENNTMFIVHPDATSKKNVTIQVKMADEGHQLERRRPQRIERIIEESPYYEDDDRYYVEPDRRRIIYEEPIYRRPAIRRPAYATEYIYMDETPPPRVHRRPRRSRVVFVEDDRSSKYEDDDVIYVDEHGNEIEYIYEDDEPIRHRQHYRTSRRRPSMNVIYD